MSRVVALTLAAALNLGCHSDAHRAEQARVAHLAERIDRLRRADNPDKRALLDALKRTECVGPDACGLKDLCVRAYEIHQRALDEIEALKKTPPDAGPSPSLRTRLGSAERDLREAKELGESCAEEQVRTVRKALL